MVALEGWETRYLESGHKRCIISRDVVFNEFEMAYETKAIVEDMVVYASSEKDSIEVELNEENQIDQFEIWHREESDIQPQTDDDDEKKGKEGYLLARDRTRRQIKLPKKYGYADLMAFSLVAFSEVMNDEPNC